MSAATPANVFLGTGRRKTSTARVRITEGSGKLVVNGRDFENYFSHENFAKQAYAPLLVVDLRDKIDVSANVAGSHPLSHGSGDGDRDGPPQRSTVPMAERPAMGAAQ